ncbi:hypothetical protein LTR85_001943 [Meristemomyces frigidus]|nr:hypothetical protein LTR85_001943 [Meristemomyces frigidus]
MEYEKAYVFQPEETRPIKRRRVESKGLQASWNSRREAYQTAWQERQEGLEACLDTINAATVDSIAILLDGASQDAQSSRIPTGIIVTDPSATLSSGILRQLSRREGSGDGRRVFVALPSSSGSNLKALLKALIQRATLRHADSEDETDEVQLTRRKGGRLLNYDLQLLCDHVKEHQIQQVVVAFEDTEAFDNDLLSELIELLGRWRDRIPFICLFSIATSIEFLQQRLSKAAIKCLNGRLFDAAPAGEVLEQVFQAATGKRSPLFLGPGLASMAIERQHDYIQSIDSFTDAAKYGYMSFYYANALSVFLRPDLDFKDVADDHFEALRTLDSSRSWARHSLANQETARVRDVLESNEHLFRLVRQKMADGREILGNMMTALTVIGVLQNGLPNTPVSLKSSLYIQAMSGKLAGSAMIRSLLLTIRRVPSDVATNLLKEVLSLDADISMPESCNELVNQLNELVQAQDDEKKPLRSEDDLKNSTLRTTVVAQKVELSKQKSALSKQDTAYTAILRGFTDVLEKYFTDTLINPKDLLFHEIFVYDLKSPYREVFTPRPRHAIERALASPHDYLDCDCCAPDQDERDEATLASTQPASAVLYQLYLESGSLINASDLWQAFHAVSGDDKDDEQTMSLFQRALAELRSLGMVKSTRKRVDHVAKVAWRGL